MKYQTKYDSLQIWHLHKLFADEAFSKWVVNEIVSGERDLSPDEIELRDQALRNAEVERAGEVGWYKSLADYHKE